MLMFNCYSCGQSFKIANENLYNKIAVQCANCDNPLPHEAVEALRRYSESYLDLIDVLYHTNSSSSSWGVSVINTESAIPKKPDYYFNRKPDEEDSFWEHRKKPFVPSEFKDDDPDLPF